MKYTVILLSALILLLDCSCESQNAGKQNVSLKNTDTLRKTVPRTFKRDVWREYYSLTNRRFGLAPLDSGYTKWQINFWLDRVMSDQPDTARLLVLKEHDGKYAATLYSYVDPPYIITDLKELAPGVQQILSPKSGWPGLLTKLNELGVYDLPHFEDLANYYQPFPFHGVNIEFAHDGNYRIYYYPNFELNPTIKEAVQIRGILQLLEQELDVKLIR